MPARPAGCYRLHQRAGSADLNHMIDTASVRQILCLLAPVRHGLVINDGVGPEALELFQLLLGGRRRDDSGARSFRELQREQRYATRAKDRTVSPGFTRPHTTKPLQAVTPAHR